MKTFTTFRQELPIFEEQKEIFLEDLSSEELYSIISDDSASEEILENVILTLFARGEIELSEEDLMELNGIAGEPPLIQAPKQLSGPKSTALTKPSSSAVSNAIRGGGEKLVTGGKTLPPAQLSGPSTVSSAAKTVAKTTAPRLGLQAAALGVGLGAGYAAKKALNLVGSGADNNTSTGNVSKLNTKSPGSGVKFKGDVPTIPSDNKSDGTKGMKLTGKTFDPTKAALSAGFSSSSAEPAKRLIGPMGGAKSDTTSPKAVSAQKSSVKQASSPVQKPVTKQAPVASKTIQKAPVQKKALPVTNKPEADPNVGGGFVTAGVSKGPTGNLRTVNTTRGKVDSTALPNKNTSTSQPLQKARNVSYAKPQDWKQASSKTVTGSNLPPQGSAARDKALADKGYKKF